MAETVARIHFTLTQGDDFARTLTFTDADGGLLWDLTGWTAAVHVRVRADAPLTVAAAVTVDPASAVTIAIGHEATAVLPPRAYVWDLKITDPDGDPATVAAGTFTVNAAITRG